MRLFAAKLERLRFLRGIAGEDATYNTGDVVDVEATRARELVAAGHAEPASDAPIGPAPTTVDDKSCPYCGYSQSFFVPRCGACGAPI